MFGQDEIPDGSLERAQMLQNLLITRATGGAPDDTIFQQLRRYFCVDPTLMPLLPDFVRSSRDLSQFWGHIKGEAATYQVRRQLIWEAFQPLLDFLEEANRAPSDVIVGETLHELKADAVVAIWQKALTRRTSDPDGAITTARQLLESVCKHILDDMNASYPADADLPKLWRICAEQLNLAPDQHNEVAFKSVLGGCQTVVQYLGTIRNRLGDAHGSGRAPVRAAPRHATLVVNLAGTMATFLVDTFLARKSP